MTRWRRASTRRERRGALNGTVASGNPRGGRRAKDRSTVTVDEYDNLILLRSSESAPPNPDDVAELARYLGDDEHERNVFTIMVGTEGADPGLWSRLATVLDSVRDRGATTVRLALSGAGANHIGRPAMAQRIADAWGFEVIAPEAGVLIVPGGSLFALGATDADWGWRSFRPGGKPTPLGPRSPAPSWQPTFARLPGRTAGGWVVEQVPAGILVRSAKAPRAGSRDLCYAVPVDQDHPTVLVDASPVDGELDVRAEDIAALLAALPETTRLEVRLAPCGPADLLPVGQDAAEILGAEVEVLTGLPLLIGTGADPEVRPVLIGADAEPTWVPFVEAVVCRPYAADGSVPGPRVVRWRSPLSGIRRTDSAAVPLSDRWQVCVTRAGLVVGPRGEAPPVTDRPVAADKLAVEVNLRGTPADDTLFAEISRLLSEIGSDQRQFVTIQRILPPDHDGEEDFRLLRLAIEHGVSLAEQPPAAAPPRPATPDVRTVAMHRAHSPAGATAAPATRPADTSDDPAARTRARFTVSLPGGARRSEAGRPAVAYGAGGAASDAPAPRQVPETPAAAGPAWPADDPPVVPPDPGPRTPESDGPAEEAPGTARPDDGPERANTPESVTGGPEGPDHPRLSLPSTLKVPSLPTMLGRIPLTPVTPVTREPSGDPDRPVTPAPAAEPPPQPAPAASASAPAEPPVPSAPVVPPTVSGGGPAAPAVPDRPDTPDSPAEPATPVTPAAPPATPVPAAQRPRPAVKPVRRSTDAERAEFRALVQKVWERHSAAVNRAMTRIPALRGAGMDAARADLVAVHLYLSGGLEELGPRDAGDPVPAEYTTCLGSGLSRLPSYRGVAVRGGLSDEDLPRFVPGGLLREPGPVSALPIAAAGPPGAGGRYVIWSSTGRRVRPLLDSTPGRTGDEVVFAPGAVFRVLDIRSAGPAPTVLLVEVVGGASADDRPGGLGDADRAALGRLEEALRRYAAPDDDAAAAKRVTWPPRCDVPLGGRAATA